MTTPDPEAGAPFTDDVLRFKVKHVYGARFGQATTILPPEAVDDVLMLERYAIVCGMPRETGHEWWFRDLLGDASYDDPWHDERPEVEPTE